MKLLLIFSMLLATSIVLGCVAQPKGYRIYGQEGTQSGEGTTISSSPSTIDMFVSTLDSIRTYVHVFPTGIRTEAPSLDPRDFCPPDSVVAWCSRSLDEIDAASISLGYPKSSYEIIGDVEARLERSSEAIRRGNLGVESHDLNGLLAPNGKPYETVTNVDWFRTLEKLRTAASEVGADSIIEVFCASGIDSYWYPSREVGGGAVYGTTGQVIGMQTTTLPAGVALSSWKVMGLAVRWRKSEN